MNKTDYARSFLQFTTDHTDHTPRAQIEASCRLIAPDGSAREYFLTAACISENMYLAENLVQKPASEFLMIASRNEARAEDESARSLAHPEEYMIFKDFSSARAGVCEAHRVGERMSTHDGKGSTMLRIDISMAEFPEARKLEDYDEIRAAILGNRPLNGRTTYLHADGKTQVVMDYPVRICNVPRSQQRWQIDTGRVLAAVRPPAGGLPITQLAPAYIVLNDWDWAELAAFNLTTVPQDVRAYERFNYLRAPDEGSSAPHYGEIRRIVARNEIFGIGAA